MQTYTAFGLTIEADLPLPELVKIPAGARANVTISRATLPKPPEGALFEDRYIVRSQAGTYFFWRKLGSLFVSGGQRIQYDLLPEGDEETLRLPLLGIGLGTLLHQRGVLTLHASAVAVDDRAVAFIGWKGSGKSTTAAALQARGHTLLTDDVVALDVTASGVLVRPAFPQLKLDAAVVATLGGDPRGLAATAPHQAKLAVRTQLAFGSDPVPLDCIYALCDGEHVASERLTACDAFITVLSQTYATRFVGTAGTGTAHFHSLNELLKQVPVYTLQRPRRLNELSDLGAFIEEHQATLA